MQEITLADLFHLPMGTMLASAGTDVLESKANVARYVHVIWLMSCSNLGTRWFEEISSMESWVAFKDGVHSTA